MRFLVLVATLVALGYCYDLHVLYRRDGEDEVEGIDEIDLEGPGVFNVNGFTYCGCPSSRPPMPTMSSMVTVSGDKGEIDLNGILNCLTSFGAGPCENPRFPELEVNLIEGSSDSVLGICDAEADDCPNRNMDDDEEEEDVESLTVNLFVDRLCDQQCYPEVSSVNIPATTTATSLPTLLTVLSVHTRVEAVFALANPSLGILTGSQGSSGNSINFEGTLAEVNAEMSALTFTPAEISDMPRTQVLTITVTIPDKAETTPCVTTVTLNIAGGMVAPEPDAPDEPEPESPDEPEPDEPEPDQPDEPVPDTPEPPPGTPDLPPVDGGTRIFAASETINVNTNFVRLSCSDENVIITIPADVTVTANDVVLGCRIQGSGALIILQELQCGGPDSTSTTIATLSVVTTVNTVVVLGGECIINVSPVCSAEPCSAQVQAGTLTANTAIPFALEIENGVAMFNVPSTQPSVTCTSGSIGSTGSAVVTIQAGTFGVAPATIGDTRQSCTIIGDGNIDILITGAVSFISIIGSSSSGLPEIRLAPNGVVTEPCDGMITGVRVVVASGAEFMVPDCTPVVQGKMKRQQGDDTGAQIDDSQVVVEEGGMLNLLQGARLILLQTTSGEIFGVLRLNDGSILVVRTAGSAAAPGTVVRSGAVTDGSGGQVMVENGGSMGVEGGSGDMFNNAITTEVGTVLVLGANGEVIIVELVEVDGTLVVASATTPQQGMTVGEALQFAFQQGPNDGNGDPTYVFGYLVLPDGTVVTGDGTPIEFTGLDQVPDGFFDGQTLEFLRGQGTTTGITPGTLNLPGSNPAAVSGVVGEQVGVTGSGLANIPPTAPATPTAPVPPSTPSAGGGGSTPSTTNPSVPAVPATPTTDDDDSNSGLIGGLVGGIGGGLLFCCILGALGFLAYKMLSKPKGPRGPYPDGPGYGPEYGQQQYSGFSAPATTPVGAPVDGGKMYF